MFIFEYRKQRLLPIAEAYRDNTCNLFFLDKDVGHWDTNNTWVNDISDEEISRILKELRDTGAQRARKRAEDYVQAHRDNWNFPDSVGKEDHRDRLRRFSGELFLSIFSFYFCNLAFFPQKRVSKPV